MKPALAIGCALVMTAVGLHGLWFVFLPADDPCTTPAGLRALPAFERAYHVGENADPERTNILQWTEGAFRNVGGDAEHKLRFRVVRTDDLSPFFGPPVAFIPSVKMPGDEQRTEEVVVDGETITVHHRINRTSHSEYFAAYVYMLGTDAVAEPAWEALRRGVAAPWRAPEPLTLLIGESSLGAGVPMVDRKRVATEWVKRAVRGFRATCG